jgi:hypothetical protein
MFNTLFIVVCVIIVVIAFSARPLKQRAMERARYAVLRPLAPFVSGTVSDAPELSGTYKGYPVEVTLRSAGRIDTIGSSTERTNMDLLLVLMRHVRGSQPWGFYTSISAEPHHPRWRSTATLGGAVDRTMRRLTPFPVDPAFEDGLLQGGLFAALDRLEPPSGPNQYAVVSYIPDGGVVVQKRIERFEAAGGRVPENARRQAEVHLQREQGGHLRIELERAGAEDPSPARFTEILDAAVAIAELNARIASP